LTIADDGCGFSIDEINEDGQFGLKGMKERAEMVGGRFEVESQPGQGTTVRLTIPESILLKLSINQGSMGGWESG
jgi:signal transduction histidine kinase